MKKSVSFKNNRVSRRKLPERAQPVKRGPRRRQRARLSPNMSTDRAPVAYDTRVEQSFSKRMKELRVVHSERFAGLLSTTSFNANIYRINPGDPLSFPWMSNIARNYTFYRVNAVAVKVITSTPTTTTGNMYMAFDYDPSADEFTSVTSIMEAEGAVSGNAYKELTCVMTQRDTMYNKYYVKEEAPSITADIRMDDIANVYIATNGQSSDGVVLGDLYISYDITLMTPIPVASTLSLYSFELDSNEAAELGDSNQLLGLDNGSVTEIGESGLFSVSSQYITCHEAGAYRISFVYTLATPIATTTGPVYGCTIIKTTGAGASVISHCVFEFEDGGDDTAPYNVVAYVADTYINMSHGDEFSFSIDAAIAGSSYFVTIERTNTAFA